MLHSAPGVACVVEISSNGTAGKEEKKAVDKPTKVRSHSAAPDGERGGLLSLISLAACICAVSHLIDHPACTTNTFFALISDHKRRKLDAAAAQAKVSNNSVTAAKA